MGFAALGWTGVGEGAGGKRSLEIGAAIAAAILLVASTASGLYEQAALGGEPSQVERKDASGATSLLPGRETMVGAFTGAPYTYPSVVRIEKPGAVDMTIDPVNWYTDPFHNPIYYGARVARWFTGGTTGMMVDFIHSKAIAERGDEASFTGTIDGKPLPPRARIQDLVRKMEFSHGHNMLLFNGLLRLPGIGPRLSPYVGAGAGVLLPHTEVSSQTRTTRAPTSTTTRGPPPRRCSASRCAWRACRSSSSTSSPGATTQRRCRKWTAAGCSSTSGARSAAGSPARSRPAATSQPRSSAIRS